MIFPIRCYGIKTVVYFLCFGNNIHVISYLNVFMFVPGMLILCWYFLFWPEEFSDYNPESKIVPSPATNCRISLQLYIYKIFLQWMFAWKRRNIFPFPVSGLWLRTLSVFSVKVDQNWAVLCKVLSKLRRRLEGI